MSRVLTVEEIEKTSYSDYSDFLDRKLLMDFKENKLKHLEYVQLSRAFNTVFSYLIAKENS